MIYEDVVRHAEENLAKDFPHGVVALPTDRLLRGQSPGPAPKKARAGGAALRGRSVCAKLRPRENVTSTGIDFLEEGARMKSRIEEFKEYKTEAEIREEKEKMRLRLFEHQRKWSAQDRDGERYREKYGDWGWTFNEMRKVCHAWKPRAHWEQEPPDKSLFLTEAERVEYEEEK